MAFLIRDAFWVSLGGGARVRRKKYSCKGKSYVTSAENWSFLGTRPSVVPLPGDRFPAQTTENRNYNLRVPYGQPSNNEQ